MYGKVHDISPTHDPAVSRLMLDMRQGVAALEIAVDALNVIAVSPTSAGDVALDALRRIKGVMAE